MPSNRSLESRHKNTVFRITANSASSGLGFTGQSACSMEPAHRRSRTLPRRYSSGCETARRSRLLDSSERYGVMRRFRSTNSRLQRSKPAECYDPYSSMTQPEAQSQVFTTGSPNADKLRSTRSHSLKVSSMHPSILHHRSKRTFSLPCSSRPIFNPLNLHMEQSRLGETEYILEDPIVKPAPIPFEDTMEWYTPVAGLSCSLALFIWSCLLSCYSS